MEKIVYLIKHNSADELLLEFIETEVLEPLVAVGAAGIQFALADQEVEAASEKRLFTTAPHYNIMLSFYLPTAIHLDGWLAGEEAETLQNTFSENCTDCDRYVVTESRVLDAIQHVQFNDRSIQRIPGWQQLALFNTPENMTREAWLETWLYSHTQIAVETQSTFGYIQNIVQRGLPGTTPAIDAMVTENFPDAAMDSLEEFYDAPGDSKKQAENETAMMASCARFIDFSNINVIPMSAYFVI